MIPYRGIAISVAVTGALWGYVAAMPHYRYPFCRAGYSASVRPPEAVTEEIKAEMVARLYPGHRIGGFELDHRVPLELGGSPLDPGNLQLQRWPDARRKDLAENRLHWAVCDGRMPLARAVAIMKAWR